MIGLTNRRDLIDAALLRPGRLEVHLEIQVCVAVCCSVLQCVAVCCSVLQ